MKLKKGKSFRPTARWTWKGQPASAGAERPGGRGGREEEEGEESGEDDDTDEDEDEEEADNGDFR
jgi:hypothetical protein